MKMALRWTVLLTMAVAAVAMCNSAARAQSLPIGAWTIDANGFVGDLDISLDMAGNVTGTAYGQTILGFWDEDAKKIVFVRVIDSADPSSFQIFTGYFFQDPLQLSGVGGGSPFFTLA